MACLGPTPYDRAMLLAREANRRYFREAYRTGIHGWETEKPSRWAVRFLRQVRRRVPAGRLLDVGCGEGRHSLAASQLGFEVTGIDYQPLALRRARRLAAIRRVEGIRFRRMNALSLSCRPFSFDVVVDWGCLHHQRKADWPVYLAGILRVLKPGGFYILSAFSPRFRFFQGARRPWHIALGAYRRCFTRPEILRLFGNHFEILKIEEERGEGRGFWHVLMKRRETS